MADVYFTFTPLFVYQSKRSHNVLESDFGTGRILRRYKSRLPREWTLSFRNHKNVINEISNFYRARKGSYESFYWIPPDETTPILVRFRDSSCNFSYGGDLYGECELTIQEVLS